MNFLQNLSNTYTISSKVTGLYNDLNELKNISKISVFCTGLKYKVSASRMELLSIAARGALYSAVTIPSIICSALSYQSGDYEKSQQYGALFASTLGIIAITERNSPKEFVVDTVIQGYYVRISEVVEKHLGDTLNTDQKESMKRSIQAILGNTQLEDLPRKISGILAVYLVNVR